MGKNQRTSRQRQKRKLGVVMGLFLLLILLAIGVFVAYFWMRLGSIHSDLDDENLQINELTPEVSGTLKDFMTIAVFGLDNTAEGVDAGLSDVIMVASINNQTKEIRMASIFRDTYLQMQGSSGNTMFRKANAAVANGGITNAVNMLNTNLDLDISEYAAVDFVAVADAVDLLGGVTVTVTEQEAHLMRGYQEEVGKLSGKPVRFLEGAGTFNLDGVQAVAYARIRFTEGDDFKRTARQRLIIELMMDKARNASLTTLTRVVDAVLPQVSTSLDRMEILGLARHAFRFTIGESGGFPFVLNTRKMTLGSLGGQDVVVAVDLIKNVELLHVFLYDQKDYKPSETVRKISAQITKDTGFTADSPSFTPDFTPPGVE